MDSLPVRTMCIFSIQAPQNGTSLFCLLSLTLCKRCPEVLRRISHHPQLFSCIVVPKQATLPHFPGCRIYFMGARQAGTKVARWQNVIPSFSWIAPGLEGVGAQSKERKGSNFAAQRSGAIVQKPERPNAYNLKIWL